MSISVQIRNFSYLQMYCSFPYETYCACITPQAVCSCVRKQLRTLYIIRNGKTIFFFLVLNLAYNAIVRLGDVTESEIIYNRDFFRKEEDFWQLKRAKVSTIYGWPVVGRGLKRKFPRINQSRGPRCLAAATDASSLRARACSLIEWRRLSDKKKEKNRSQSSG